MPTNVDEFSKEIDKFNKTVKVQLVKFHKDIVHSVYKEIVKLSPVWSGQFRGNHNIMIGGMDTKVRFNPAAQTTSWPTTPNFVLRPRGDKYIKGRLSKLKPFENVNITNALDYAFELEGGRSPQAPAGIYLIAATKVSFRFRGRKVRV